MDLRPTVFVVDDDQAVRESTQRLMQSVDLAVEVYPDAVSFLEGYDPGRPGCLLLDIRMPGMSGLDLQERLVEHGVRIPVIVISAHGDVEQAVRAMKAGAVDFIKKPCQGPVLLERIREALVLDSRIRQIEAERAEIAARAARLTPRECEVASLLSAGDSPKQIALKLGLSRKTVDVHRGHIVMKMRADSLIELSLMMRALEPDDDGPSA